MGGGDVELGKAASGHAAFPARSTGSERELRTLLLQLLTAAVGTKCWYGHVRFFAALEG